MILVTGAAGKTGRAVIRALAARGAAVRAFVRRTAQTDAARDAGARETAVGRLDDTEALTAAAQGGSAIYHICPNVSPDELAFGEAAVAAARAGGVRRFVFHSVLRPQIEAMPHHWRKLRVEERLFASGLEVTVLQPAPYMQNILAALPDMADAGVYRVPYSIDARLSLVDLEDVGEAAAIVLTEPGHEHATYELAGTPPTSAREIASAFAKVLGRPVRAEAEPVAAWEAGPGAGLATSARETLARMFGYYDRHGLSGSPRVLRGLLGRAPGSLDEFAARVAGGRAAHRG